MLSAQVWEAAERFQGQGSVSCEPRFCLLFFINIPLVLLMGKKLNTGFLVLSGAVGAVGF